MTDPAYMGNDLLPAIRVKREPLTAEREKELATLRDAGSVAARNELIERNTGLVLKIARKYAQWGLGYDDAAGAGFIALVEAADGFNPEYGKRFGSFAGTCIVRAMLEAVAKHSYSVDIPYRMAKYLPSYWHAEESASSNPDWECDWVATLGITREGEPQNVVAAMRCSRVTSGDTPMPDSSRGLFNIMPSKSMTPVDILMAAEQRRIEEKALKRYAADHSTGPFAKISKDADRYSDSAISRPGNHPFPEAKRRIIELVYQHGSMEEVARKLGCSRNGLRLIRDGETIPGRKMRSLLGLPDRIPAVSARNASLTDQDVRYLIEEQLLRHGTVKALAAVWGVNRNHLTQVLNGKLPVMESTLKALGLRKIVTVHYERILERGTK